MLHDVRTGVTHHIRNNRPAYWNTAVRLAKKRGLPDAARFRVWTRCHESLRANSLATSQTVTCIACLMQPPAKAVQAAWPAQQMVHRYPPISLSWLQNLEERIMNAGRINVPDLNHREPRWIDGDDVVHRGNFQNTQMFVGRCGVAAFDAVNAATLPAPPTVTCIACVLWQRPKR